MDSSYRARNRWNQSAGSVPDGAAEIAVIPPPYANAGRCRPLRRKGKSGAGVYQRTGRDPVEVGRPGTGIARPRGSRTRSLGSGGFREKASARAGRFAYALKTREDKEGFYPTARVPREMGIPRTTIDRLLEENKDHVCPGSPEICVRVVAIAELPSRFGDYQVVAFWNNFDKKEHAAFIHGDIIGKERVPVRIHSECLTGDAIGSLRCDCRDQLIESLDRIGKMESGVILYLRQEGRGIGFANKIRAYQLQDSGYDTVQANELLGFKPDERDYGVAAHMLGSLEVESIQIMTNNPAKVKDLQRHGVRIEGRIPVIVPPNEYDRPYLETKRKKMGHLLDIEQPDDLVDYEPHQVT
jgi:GTP cyclohydrolase II